MNIPKGFKLVPIEPTEDMLYTASWVHGPGGDGEVKRRIGLEYCTAIAASPIPPKPIYDEEKERRLFEDMKDEDGGNIDRDSMGDYENPYIQSAWEGWQSCAQSRVKAGEHE